MEAALPLPESGVHDSDQWCAVVLGKGHDTSLKRDITNDVTNLFSKLLDTPDALIPIAGIPALDRWRRHFLSAGIHRIFVVSDAADYPKLLQWATTRGLPVSNLLIDDRLSAGKALCGACSFRQLFGEARHDVLTGNLLVVSCDTLLPDEFNLKKFLSQLLSPIGVLCGHTDSLNHIVRSAIYDDEQFSDQEDHCSKNCDENSYLYAFRKSVIPIVETFFESPNNFCLLKTGDLKKMTNWLLETTAIKSSTENVAGFSKFSSLATYKAVLADYSEALLLKSLLLPRSTSSTCSARVGLMGNPSDGFEGRTLSFLIKNFCATVTIRENIPDSSGIYSSSITLVPHPVLDPTSFCDMCDLQLHTVNKVN